MLEKLRSREELKNTQESEAIYRNSFYSSLPTVHISFPKLLHPMELICTLAWSCFSPLAWHGSCQWHKIVLVASTSLEFWDNLSFKRMCVKFPIFSIALTELVVDAYQNHFSTLLSNLCPLDGCFGTFSSKSWFKIMKMYLISLSQVCSEEPLVIGKILPNPETVCPRPINWQQFFVSFAILYKVLFSDLIL